MLVETTGSIRSASSSITLDEAVHRGLRYNQKLKAQAMARDVAHARARLARGAMLPDIIATSEGFGRYSADLSGLTGARRLNGSAALGMSLSLLDFGLAQIRAGQADMTSEVFRARERAAAQALIAEIRVTFWQTVALQNLQQKLAGIDRTADEALLKIKKMQARNLADPFKAMALERDLLSARSEVDQQLASLLGAEQRLRALINFPQDLPLALAGGDGKLATSLDQLRKLPFQEQALMALTNRPEMHEAMLTEHISAENARLAFIELFPNLSLAAGSSFDVSELVVGQGVVSLASSVAVQITKLAQYPAQRHSIEAQRALDRQQARALTVSIILQSQISLLQLVQAERELKTASELLNVQVRLTRHVENLLKVGRVGRLEPLREQLALALAQSRRDVAFAKLQGAHGDVLTSFGLSSKPGSNGDEMDGHRSANTRNGQPQSAHTASNSLFKAVIQ